MIAEARRTLSEVARMNWRLAITLIVAAVCAWLIIRALPVTLG